MWMGTRQGLRRFDGSGFVAYYHHSGQDSTSLADNEVHSLCTDRSGRLWVGTANGLQRYVPEDDSFRLVQLQGEDLKGRILDIVRLRDGSLLCAVANVGIFRVDGVAMTAYPVLTENGIFHPSHSCLLFEDSRKQLWVGTDREGVVRMDLGTGKGKRYGLPLAGVEDIVEAYKAFYQDEPFTHYVDRPLDMKQVVNTNKCLVHCEKYGDKLLITSCIDNLLKGAVGQAVQNMNIMFGEEETMGLRLKPSAF